MKPCSVIPLLAIFAGVLTGCGGGNGFPDPTPVSGSVSVNGKPVEDAVVTFLSTGDGTGRSASGSTDAEGKFQLTTFSPDDGAIPGEYTVTIAKIQTNADIGEVNAEAPSQSYEQMMSAAGSGNMSAVEKNALPKKYGDASTSGLTRSVVDGQENVFDFELE